VRRFATVRVRITLAALVVVGIALTAGGFWLVRAQRNSLTDNIETAAALRARDIASSASDGAIPSVIAVPRGDENLVQIVDVDGKVIASSANIAGEPRISGLLPGEDGYTARTVTTIEDGEGPFRVVASRMVNGGTRYTVYVAGSLEPVDDSIESLRRLLFVALPILLTLLGVTCWIVTGRALRPVESMRREVEAIGAADLHRRVPEPATADEIGRLAQTMNAMLGRLESSQERQRRFVADASHELRSPLTGIRAQLEVDLEHPADAHWEATERGVLADTIRLQRLVEDLLAVAAADASTEDATHRAAVDVDEIVLAEARRQRSIAAVQIDTSRVSGAQLSANADQLVRVVRNLLDNATRHARSTVTVSLVETASDVVLRVTDDGPGVPPDARDRIFERFARLDDARASDNGGTGLGLAIVHDVVDAHHGTVTVADNTPGATFTVTLPLDA
jgi:signal transduction histidine kinase